ncbi:MAG: hypothetical protein ACJ789_10935 [Thermomicrobiales bacterium]
MTDLAERLARGWVCLYTLGLRPEVRAARRAEIASDLWEHRHDAAATGAPGLAAAVLGRVLAGMPSDVLWRVEARGSAPGASWRSQRGLQTAIVWGTAVFAAALSLLDAAGMPVLAFVGLGVGGVLLVAGLLRAVLGSPGGPISASFEEDQMDVDTYRGRRVRLLVVLGASVAIVLAMWAYAVSLDDWGGARTVVFTVGGLVFPVIALGALVLLIADLLRMRRV